VDLKFAGYEKRFEAEERMHTRAETGDDNDVTEVLVPGRLR